MGVELTDRVITDALSNSGIFDNIDRRLSLEQQRLITPSINAMASCQKRQERNNSSPEISSCGEKLSINLLVGKRLSKKNKIWNEKTHSEELKGIIRI